MRLFNLIIFLAALLPACQSQNRADSKLIEPGAWQTSEYLPLLKGKSVGLVINQTSTIGKKHLIDTLLAQNINIKRIFAPEHGYRGDAYDGKIIDDSIDPITGISVISIYGKNKKPRPEHLEDIDLMIYDIQDVGARFYTFISTLHYVMEACAENNIKLLLLDRPNPNGHYIGGPVLDMDYKSFIGMHPIPMVYGLTPGELAQMINGENWLDSARTCAITIVKNKNYTHKSRYELPIPPSPNLPNARAIELYPSLCLFEATIISVGRGTSFPFQVLGYPDSTKGDFTFTPVSIEHASKYPKHENIECFGDDLRHSPPVNGLDLSFLIDYAERYKDHKDFINRADYFDLLAGNDKLRQQLLSGMSQEEMERSWEPALNKYKAMRQKYLLYPDFE